MTVSAREVGASHWSGAQARQAPAEGERMTPLEQAALKAAMDDACKALVGVRAKHRLTDELFAHMLIALATYGAGTGGASKAEVLAYLVSGLSPEELDVFNAFLDDDEDEPKELPS